MSEQAEKLARALNLLMDAIVAEDEADPIDWWPDDEWQAAEDALAAYNNPDHVEPAPANVKEIVAAHLKANGFDGLCGPNDGTLCECRLSDLMHYCSVSGGECCPGYLYTKTIDTGEVANYIHPDKPAPAEEGKT